jgi:DNA-binding CsgD family transcriptional regulator
MATMRALEGSLEFLETAYDWELPEREWLGALTRTMARLWGRPRWACAFTYDLADTQRLSFGEPVLVDGSPLVQEFLVDGLSHLTPEMLGRSFRINSMGFARPMGLINEASADRLRQMNTLDFFGINGRDASGRGCFVGIGAERTRLTAGEIMVYQRLAHHLGSAYRVRRRLSEQGRQPFEGCEAILDLDGRLIEARGPAQELPERQALSLAARGIQAVRVGRREDEPTSRWRPRVFGRWTLVDAFRAGGRRYLVARENEVRPEGLDRLTAREQQVVAGVAAGMNSKEIAYDLGISPVTVRVLLARAYERLGVQNRKALLELPTIRALRGESPAAE